MHAPRRRHASSERYLNFPPGQANILVPTAPARAAALGTTMYTASNPIPLAAQMALWAAARVGAQRVIPGHRGSWSLPIPDPVRTELYRSWSRLCGAEIEATAVYRRPQSSRPGSVLLLSSPRGALLVRLRRDPSELQRDVDVSDTASRLRPRSFRVPALVATGAEQGWHWSAFEVMSRRPHRPVRRVDTGLTEEISLLVEQVVPRPASTPAHWTGSHGDLTPWNLRRTDWRVGSPRCTPWLIDWEDAGWAPPGSDLVYFAAASASSRGHRPAHLRALAPYAEAAARCAAAVRSRPDDDPALTRRMLGLLDHVG